MFCKGSNHADDIQYVFGYPLYAGPRSTGNYTEEERRLARGMVTMWTNFAKSGYVFLQCGRTFPSPGIYRYHVYEICDYGREW
ncbi:hypothetical protein DPMN_055733 [Dreissena polymorpha]|uniref:Carboxylesterase type B domain-containing protein n=1 Tax=Dreissena polymorpha TaxID=45954 RepID=A0A9D4CT58_DREPO|nr:hypothetical protein DPMN_055733 [Dreissena polymorpha]